MKKVYFEFSEPLFYHHFLDTAGLSCPLPVLKLKQIARRMNADEVVLLLSTDDAAVKDIPAFCKDNGLCILATDKQNSAHRFCIKKYKIIA